MNKCLVTKFKAVVDDPDLPFFGEVNFHLKRVLDRDGLYLSGSIEKPITVTILGDNDIVFDVNNKKSLIITSTGKIYFTGGIIEEEFYVRLVSKYDMSDWTLTNNGGTNMNAMMPIFPAGALIYHTNIVKIGADNSSVIMPVTDLIASGNVISVIHNGGSCIISGNYEEYLVTIWENGRKSNYLTLERCTPEYYPSKPDSLALGISSSAKVEFAETSITMSFYNKETPDVIGAKIIATATYDGSTWTYEMV